MDANRQDTDAHSAMKWSVLDLDLRLFVFIRGLNGVSGSDVTDNDKEKQA
jgi:hypothetical protein